MSRISGKTNAKGALTHFRTLEFTLGLLFVGAMGLAVVFSGIIFPDGGETIDLTARLLPPFTHGTHSLGTDPLGRDVLARIVTGGKISLEVGLLSVAGAVALGVIMGMMSGYYRGLCDMIVMRLVDIQLALPFILLAMTIIAIFGGSLSHTIILLIVSQWVQYARLVRGLVMALRERDFIQQAKAIGVGDVKLLFSHLLPNLMGPVIVLMTLNIANNILLESSLTFLGLGIDPTIPSWGGMLAQGRTYLQNAWWIAVFPGLAIMVTVLGFNLLGDWLRDRLDPTGTTLR